MNITNLLYNKYYIIRTGDFATNANKKIIYITLGLGLCFHDYNVNHTMEYYYVMFGSSFIWTLIELFLNQQQIPLTGSGVISLGQPVVEGAQLIQYGCV